MLANKNYEEINVWHTIEMRKDKVNIFLISYFVFQCSYSNQSMLHSNSAGEIKW